MGTNRRALIITLFVTMATAMMPQVKKDLVSSKVSEKDISYRLPKDVAPVTYVINLEPLLEEPFTFLGDVTITVNVINEVDSIVLHSNGLEIIKTEVTDNNEVPLVTKEPVYDEERHFLTISKDSRFAVGQYKIRLEFRGELSDDMYGFYKSSYTTQDTQTRWLATTQFQPTHARRAFPCFDEPEFKAKFTISILTPPGYHTLSNMDEASRVNENEKVRYKFKETPNMPSYLIAFIISDFEHLTEAEDKYSFSAWARPEAIEHAKYSQSVGPALVHFFEEYTGIDYKLPKIDQVALPDFAAGAMENWGLITYRETGLLFYDGISTESNKKGIARVVAHELAHMWFGNLVTLDWWEHTWLNEGFATIFQYLATAEMHKQLLLQYVTSQDMILSTGGEKLAFYGSVLVDQQHTVFLTDALTSAQALSSECYTPAQIMGKFTSISYNKGGSVLRMLSHMLTPDTFKKGLQKYLFNNQFSNTIPRHLFDDLEVQRKADNIGIHEVPDFLQNWITNPGYPVIYVKRNNNKIIVTQERFLLKGSEPENEKQVWYVPLTWTKKSDAPNGFDTTYPAEWIIPSDTEKELNVEVNNDEWIIINNQETGYYRVNYETSNWDLIERELQDTSAKRIHVLNRAQLVDDALNLARAKKLEYATALKLTRFLANEDDYIPWASALNALSFLNSRLVSVEGYEHFQKYILHLVDKSYKRLTFKEESDEMQTDKFLRANIISWACRFGNEDCIKQAKEMFQKYQEDTEKNPINANLKSAVFCTALANGADNEWNFLWDRYEKSLIATEKVTILSALGCTNDEGLLKQYLQKSIDANSGIRKQDAASVFSAVYSNPKGVGTAFEFLKTNYKEIAQYYGGMNAIANSIAGIAGRLTTAQQVEELEKFIEEKKDDLGSAAEAGQNAVESATADLTWTNQNKDTIITWFKNEMDPGGANGIHIASMSIIVLALISAFLM